MAMIKTFMDFVRFALTVTRPFSFTVLDTIYRLIFGPKPVLPPIDNEILLIPASELAEKIRKKQLKAEDVMKAYIKRIQEVEPYVHACIDERFEEALKEAKEVDNFLLNTIVTEEEIQNHKPLLGIPFSCKENVGVKGLAQNSGMYNAKDRKAPEDGVCTALYRKAGAIPVVVTNVPEFCSWWETQNVPFGRTFNPYDNVRIAGGSSGGEGAILGYAGSAIGIGNDLAGSIRMPSAFNGIYGHKPSPGLISNEGCWPPDDEGLKNFVGTGPMCRYAKDLPLVANILSESKIKFDREVNFRKIRIYYMEQFPGYLLKPIPEITAAIQKARNYFEDTFSNKPTEINIPEMRYALEIWESKLLEAGTVSMRECIESVSLLQEFIKYIFNQSKHTLPVIYYASIERRKKDSYYHKFISMFNSIKEKLDFILENDGILLLPTHPEPPPHHLLTIPKYPNQAYTCIFNVLGYPSTQIPAGSSNGLPIGLQIIGAMNNDCLCISTAVELEKIFGGWSSPSKIVI